jgi:hypothetical protein
MKLNNEEFKAVFIDRDLDKIEMVVNTLRSRFNWNYDSICSFCCDRSGIDSMAFEELMMDLDDRESQCA